MSAPAGYDEQPRVYAIRLSQGASDQIEEERDRLEMLSGYSSADAWQDALMDAIAGLATLPEQCAIAPEDTIFREAGKAGALRQLLYRRTRSGAAWRILFSVHEADENDAATVWVHRVRHAAQAPMTEWPLEQAE